MHKNYGGVIWTNHAISRLQDRKIKQGDAWVTWKNPDKSRFSKSKHAFVYERTFGNQAVEVVAKKNEKNEWIILSVWNKSGFKLKEKKISSFPDFLRKLLHIRI